MNISKQKSNVWIGLTVIFSMITLATIVLTIAFIPLYKKKKTCVNNSDCLHEGICLNGKCKCTTSYHGDTCENVTTILGPVGGNPRHNCMRERVPCVNSGDCTTLCSNTNTEWHCDDITKACVPTMPSSFRCGLNSLNDRKLGTNEMLPIREWVGWGSSNSMGWKCACEYPQYYELSPESDVCTLRSQVCAHGQWTYPCLRDPLNVNKCLDVDPATINTAPPLIYGKCTCKDAPCSSDSDCVTTCGPDKKCVKQRTSIDPVSGVQVCVSDTCNNNSSWVTSNSPPYIFGQCSSSSSSSLSKLSNLSNTSNTCPPGCVMGGAFSGCNCSKTCKSLITLSGVQVRIGTNADKSNTGVNTIVAMTPFDVFNTLHSSLIDSIGDTVAIGAIKQIDGTYIGRTYTSQLITDVMKDVNNNSATMVLISSPGSVLYLCQSTLSTFLQGLMSSVQKPIQTITSISDADIDVAIAESRIALIGFRTQNARAFQVLPNNNIEFIDSKLVECNDSNDSNCGKLDKIQNSNDSRYGLYI